jgi:hypothetical protein
LSVRPAAWQRVGEQSPCEFACPRDMFHMFEGTERRLSATSHEPALAVDRLDKPGTF